MNKRKAITLSIIIAVLIFVAVIGVVQIALDDYDGGGGIDYDPECYPFDERGVPPNQRGPWLNRQPTPTK